MTDEDGKCNARCRPCRRDSLESLTDDDRDQAAEDTAWLVLGWIGVGVLCALALLMTAYLWASGG